MSKAKVKITPIQRNSFQYTYANGRVFNVWKHNDRWLAQEVRDDTSGLVQYVGRTRAQVVQAVVDEILKEGG